MTTTSTTKGTCRVCGRAIRWVSRRYAWVHATKPAQDHPPIPDRTDPEPTCGGQASG